MIVRSCMEFNIETHDYIQTQSASFKSGICSGVQRTFKYLSPFQPLIGHVKLSFNFLSKVKVASKFMRCPPPTKLMSHHFIVSIAAYILI